MSENVSSSVDDYMEVTDDEAINDPEIESVRPKLVDNSIDSRRRLESRLAERQLEKDIREFDFDF